MKLFKKAKALFQKMTGASAAAPPGPRPPPTPKEPPLPVFSAPLPKYQQEQRDFEERAKATTIVHYTGVEGTLNAGRNAAKRAAA